VNVDIEDVFKIIEKEWPVHIAEVAERLQMFPGNEAEREKLYEMIGECFESLHRDRKIELRIIEGSAIAWPAEVKRLKPKV